MRWPSFSEVDMARRLEHQASGTIDGLLLRVEAKLLRSKLFLTAHFGLDLPTLNLDFAVLKRKSRVRTVATRGIARRARQRPPQAHNRLVDFLHGFCLWASPFHGIFAAFGSKGLVLTLCLCSCLVSFVYRGGMSHFRLESLPDEIVGLLVEFSFNLVGLWKCGSGALNAKLARGVTRVDLKDDNWTTTSRWPKMLSRLTNLRYLFVKREKGRLLQSSEDLSRQIRALSPTLRELSLSFEEWDLALHNFDPDTGKVVDTQHERGLSPWFDISSHFPALEKVAFPGKPSPYFRPHHIAALPDTILSVTLSSVKIVAGEDNVCALLPRKCEYFKAHLTLSSHGNDALPHFPQSLTHLESIFLNQATEVALLPRGIKTGSISLQRFPWSSEMASAVPPCFDNVDISSIPTTFTTWPEELPRHLRTLFALNVLGITLDAHIVSALPRTLETLRMPALINYTSLQEWQNSKNGASPWPPRLATIHTDRSIHGEVLTRLDQHLLLPRSLTSLTTWTEYGVVPIAWTGLPRGLKDISISWLLADPMAGTRIGMALQLASAGGHLHPTDVSFASQPHNIDFPKDLPPTLETLNLHGNFVRTSLNELPASLRTLLCNLSGDGAPNPEPCTNLRLPSNLTRLYIANWDLNFQLLPRTLTSATLFNVAVPAGTESHIIEDAILELPESLVELNLSSQCELPLLRRFAVLPQLTQLTCTSFGQFDSTVLHTLAHSKRLRTLHINLKSIDRADMPALATLKRKKHSTPTRITKISCHSPTTCSRARLSSATRSLSPQKKFP